MKTETKRYVITAEELIDACKESDRLDALRPAKSDKPRFGIVWHGYVGDDVLVVDWKTQSVVCSISTVNQTVTKALYFAELDCKMRNECNGD